MDGATTRGAHATSPFLVPPHRAESARPFRQPSSRRISQEDPDLRVGAKQHKPFCLFFGKQLKCTDLKIFEL